MHGGIFQRWDLFLVLEMGTVEEEHSTDKCSCGQTLLLGAKAKGKGKYFSSPQVIAENPIALQLRYLQVNDWINQNRKMNG